jgi:hypothetical protein
VGCRVRSAQGGASRRFRYTAAAALNRLLSSVGFQFLVALIASASSPKRYEGNCRWKEDRDVEAHARSPRDLFEGRPHYEIPLFQRPYVWNEEDQWSPL